MGGDGGVIASNRRYMRGAGTADHTGDAARTTKKDVMDASEREVARAMTTCHISGKPLEGEPVVVCPLGRLYRKEVALEALLARKQLLQQQQQQQNHGDAYDSVSDCLGWHIRNRKDLHDVHFHYITVEGDNTAGSNKRSKRVPACPVTGKELNGRIPAFVVKTRTHKKQDNKVNVYSEKCLVDPHLKDMVVDLLGYDFGTFEQLDTIRILPPPELLEELTKRLMQQQQRSEDKSVAKSKSHKRKRVEDKAACETVDTTSVAVCDR